MRHTSRVRQLARPPAPRAIVAAQPPSHGVRCAVGLLLGGLLLTGCGGPAAAPPPVQVAPAGLPSATPDSTPTATPTPAVGSSPSTSPPASAAAVRLPWPAPDAAATAELQRSVDAGSEPWLLDPAEVAVSYATAAYGWTRAEARPRPGGTTVDVAEGNRMVTLSLRQPGRTGAGGIWVVTADSAG